MDFGSSGRMETVNILVAVDNLTKWADVWPIPDQEAKIVTQIFVEQFVTRFGAPNIIHNDQGKKNLSQSCFRKCDDCLG